MLHLHVVHLHVFYLHVIHLHVFHLLVFPLYPGQLFNLHVLQVDEQEAARGQATTCRGGGGGRQQQQGTCPPCDTGITPGRWVLGQGVQAAELGIAKPCLYYWYAVGNGGGWGRLWRG